jgi:hypothetical protein
MQEKLLEPNLYKDAPNVCPKPGCGGTVFIPHEDGWQCFNCMKIIYKANELKKIYVKRYGRNN